MTFVFNFEFVMMKKLELLLLTLLCISTFLSVSAKNDIIVSDKKIFVEGLVKFLILVFCSKTCIIEKNLLSKVLPIDLFH